MPHAHNRSRPLALATAILACQGLAVLASASDTDLFRTNVAPNVLLIVDNSKSMTNTVWHSDYGNVNPVGSPVNAGGSRNWKNQDDCTEFRDAFTAAGITGTQKFRFYPGGRKVNHLDGVNFIVRTRKDNPKIWETSDPQLEVRNAAGDHVFNDANANGIQDAGEWLAYYKVCNPNTSSSDWTNNCGNAALEDYDGDGIPGQTVRDAAGAVIYYDAPANTQPYIYKYDPNNSLGKTNSLGAGNPVKERATILPNAVANTMGIDLNDYELTSNICGVNVSALSNPYLWTGENDATTPSGSTLQVTAQYLDFLFSSPYGDAARDAIFNPTAGNDGVRTKSACLTITAPETSSYLPYRRTRVEALRLILRTVTCELREDVRFGLMQFRFHGKPGDDNGGYVAVPVEALRDSAGNKVSYTLHGITATHEDHLARVVNAVGPDAQTPLNESLYQAYTYFMSRDPAQLPPGRAPDGTPVVGTSFPTYEYNMDLHNPLPDDGGDLNMVGGHYVGNAISTTHPKPASATNLDADGEDPLGDGGTAPFPAWDSSEAPDPVLYDCQRNFVLLITDGGSSGDKFDDEDVRINNSFSPSPSIETATDLGYADFTTLIGNYVADAESETGSGSGTKYMDDIAAFMTTWDFRPDFPGEQTIDLYTVGYSVTSTGVSNVEKAANAGNGLYFESADADQLAQDIIAALTDIIEKSQSFTSATVPASRTTDGDNFYSSYFRPLEDTPYWDGHLKNFKFTQAGDILTGNDKCAIGDPGQNPPCPTSGLLQTQSDGVWDAAEEMPDPKDRKLLIGAGGTSFGTEPPVWWTPDGGGAVTMPHFLTATLPSHPQPVGDSPTLTTDPYNLPDPYTSTDLENLTPTLVSSLAGCEYGTLLGSDCAARENDDGDRSILGDIFHSNPVVVGSPNAPINDSAYQQFASAYRKRSRAIYAGANDGWLHAFNAGDWQTEDPPGTPLIPPRHDRGTGVELFGFMPSAIRDNVWRLPGSQAAGTVREVVTVDGSPIAADVWLYRNTTSGALGSVVANPVSTSKSPEQWRTVAIGGLRGGGSSYYALDITNPQAPNFPGNPSPAPPFDAVPSFPGYLWEFPCDDCANAATVNGVSAGTFSTANIKDWMGQTWSEPIIIRVKVAVDGALGGHDRWVAIFGGGYHACGDPNSLEYWKQAPGEACDALNPTKFRAGRAMFMVDITTGQLLGTKFFNPTLVGSAGAGYVGIPEMKYAFASSPAAFDIDFDGYTDLIYFPDLGGNIWKWVVRPIGDDPLNNGALGGNNKAGQPDWPLQLFFQADHSGDKASPVVGAAAGTHFQNFYFPPTGILDGGDLVLGFGAGERISPESGSADSDPTNNNRYYVVHDTDPFLASPPVTFVTPQKTDTSGSTLVDLSDIDSGSKTCNDIYDGYYLTGEDREKFITDSVGFLGEILTGSFVPAPSGANPCDASGQAYLYRFSVDCGTGAYPSNPGTGNDKRRKAVGGGLPTRPRVSVGQLNQGGGGGGCTNKVVLITSDGEIENECPGTIPSSGVDIQSWRER